MMKQPTLCIATLLLLLLSACREDVKQQYANIVANFAFRNVNTVPQLNAALNNPGEYCTIVLDRNTFLFTNHTGTTKVNQTALNNYTNFRMGLSGFIVGMPNIPEPGSDVAQVVCYDLACPNCYHAQSITRSLTMKEGGYAECNHCKRVYNLNTQGIVVSDGGGESLFRYRVSFGNNVLVINNQ